MYNWLKHPFIALTAAVLLFSCAKNEPFVNPVYQCECGTMTWNGNEFSLSLAEYINIPETGPLSRRYYATSDITLEGEFETHNLNFTLQVDTVTQSVFFVEANPNLGITLEEVNFNDPLLPIREYTAVGGTVTINANVFGGPETVVYELQVKEVFDGVPVGFPLDFTGSMTVEITN